MVHSNPRRAPRIARRPARQHPTVGRRRSKLLTEAELREQYEVGHATAQRPGKTRHEPALVVCRNAAWHIPRRLAPLFPSPHSPSAESRLMSSHGSTSQIVAIVLAGLLIVAIGAVLSIYYGRRAKGAADWLSAPGSLPLIVVVITQFATAVGGGVLVAHV